MEITSNLTLELEDRIIEVNLARKDKINTGDARIAIITMLTQDNQIEPMEMAREDNTTTKTEMTAIFKILMEDKEYKERLPTNLDIRVKMLKPDLEEIRLITKTLNKRELLLSTARSRL